MNPETSAKNTSGRKQIAGKIVKIILTLGMSAFLVLWLFRKVDFHNVWHIIISGEVRYGFIIAVVPVVILSHIIRGCRWGIQLRAAGLGHVPGLTLCCSIFGAYAMNLLVPYMGEAWRIVWMARRNNAPVSTVLGTDIGDRGSDAVVVVMLLLIAIITGHPFIEAFLGHYAVGRTILHILADPWLWIGATCGIGIAASISFIFRRKRVMRHVILTAINMWRGFKILFTMKGRVTYLVLTIGIWTCYFLETYLAFFAFPFTRELIMQPGMAWGLLPALISFVFSSMSMLIPSNGGLGPWNLAVMFALSLFGIGNADGTAFSMLLWSTESITLIGLGLFTAAYALVSKGKNKKDAFTKTPA